MTRLFVDLDGVLTDFDDKAAETFGVSKNKAQEFIKKNPQKSWGLITKSGEDFWSGMKWQPDGKELWEGLKKYNPTILSSPTRHPSSVIGKKKWLEENLPGVPSIIDSGKAKYAEKGAVLVDDLSKNTTAWENQGGTAILHKGAAKTLAELAKLNGNGTRKKEAVHERIRKIAKALERFTIN